MHLAAWRAARSFPTAAACCFAGKSAGQRGSSVIYAGSSWNAW